MLWLPAALQPTTDCIQHQISHAANDSRWNQFSKHYTIYNDTKCQSPNILAKIFCTAIKRLLNDAQLFPQHLSQLSFLVCNKMLDYI